MGGTGLHARREGLHTGRTGLHVGRDWSSTLGGTGLHAREGDWEGTGSFTLGREWSYARGGLVFTLGRGRSSPRDVGLVFTLGGELVFTLGRDWPSH